MKKYMLIALVAFIAVGAAQATDIYTEDFSAVTLVTDPNADGQIYYPADYSAEQWGISGTSVSIQNLAAGPRLLIAADGDGAVRGAAVTIDSAGFIGAGTYTLNFTIDVLWAKSTLDLEIWETTSAADNSFWADVLQGSGDECLLGVDGVSSATINRLTETNYVDGSEGIYAIDFTYDGSSDITLLLSCEATGWDQRAIVDDVSITTTNQTDNNKPVFTVDPFSSGDALEDAAYNDTIFGSATDPDGDPLTYSKDSGPAWLNVATNGVLSGTPLWSDVGVNAFTVKADDGKASGSDTATLNITVINVPDAPVFAMDTIYRPNAIEDVAFTSTLFQTASDRDNDSLTYSIVGSPWLTIDPDGTTLSGTPSSSDLGENLFTVQVDDGNGGSDTATMNIQVVPEAAWCGRPNILYVLVDDMGYNDLSVHGQLEFSTPNIDSIFTGGIRFKAALVANSVCAPSRAGLITGRSGSRFGFESNVPHVYASQPGSTIGLDTNQVTLADVLKTRGYKTFGMGKWHLGDNDALFHPNLRGFDEYYGMIGGSRSYFQMPAYSHTDSVTSNGVWVTEPSDMYITDFLTDQALEYISDQTMSNPDQPWFMYMSYTAPHAPMDAKAEDLARVEHIAAARYSDASDKEGRRTYAAMVLSLDDNVGRLLNRLGELGIADSTLIVFHSDNGGPLGSGGNYSDNAPLRGEKGTLWEGGIRVPFGISYPGIIPAGQVIGYDTPISSLDMMPTFAAISGADQVQDIRTDGVNLMPLLRNRTSTLAPRNLYWRRGTMTQIATRSGDYKYYKNRNLSDEYLYDHSSSAGEWTNLKTTEPAILAQLQGEYAAYEATLADVHWNADGELLAITTYDLDDAEAGTAYFMALTYSKPSAAPVATWSIIAGNPGWLSIHPTTGELSGTPLISDPKYNEITLQIISGTDTSTYKVSLLVSGGADPDDTDADGLPDAWEMDQFGNLVSSDGLATDDYDLDGVSDLDEYIEGTSAINSDSYFTMPITIVEDAFFVSFSGTTNRDYVLHTSTNLVDGEWCYADSIDNLQSNGTVTLEAKVCDDSDAMFGRVKTEVE